MIPTNPAMKGLSLVLGLLMTTGLVLATPAAACDECWSDQNSSHAEITEFGNGATTFQVAGTATSIPAGQSAVFSTDGGFSFTVEYSCLEAYVVEEFRDGVKTNEYWGYPECSSGADQHWVDMGLETAEIDLVLHWWGCDGRQGGDEESSYAGDPPLFTPDGELRALA